MEGVSSKAEIVMNYENIQVVSSFKQLDSCFSEDKGLQAMRE